jgi:Fe-S-cluster containining protein
MSWESFKSQYADPRWPFDHSVLVLHHQGACPFLNENRETRQALCRIHSFKPVCCSEWECKLDRADCREGLRAVWELEIDADGKISGESAKIARFAGFLLTLE